MDSELYTAARSGTVAFLRGKREDATTLLPLILQKTPKGNSVLHIAAEFNRLDFFKEAVELCPDESLLQHANSRGNTALHFAAKEGSTDVVNFITGQGASYKDLLRMVNRDGDNALHLAARYGHYEVAKSLVEADPELAKLENKAGQSACFMATVRKNTMMVDLLLSLKQPCSLRGDANGMTALHEALFTSNKAIAEKILNARPEMMRESDANGWIPLHYAAACDGSVDAVKFLLERDPSAVYLVDKQGDSALHVAAFNGHISAMEVLLHSRPDCGDILNNKGQTFLHAAVLGGKLAAVEFILGVSKRKSIGQLADNDGNTPLHLAAMCKNKMMMAALCEGKKSYERSVLLILNGANKKNLTALDIYDGKVEGLDNRLTAEREEKIGLQQRQERAIYKINKIMKDAYRLRELTISSIDRQEDYYTGQDKESELKLIEVTSTLIATVTFAVAFTMPGGYNQSGGPNEGMAVLSAEKAFQAFVIFDILAFYLAITVVLCQLNAVTVKGKRAKTTALDDDEFKIFFLEAFLSMGLAFACGMYVVLVKSAGFGLATLILPTSLVVAFFYAFTFLFKI